MVLPIGGASTTAQEAQQPSLTYRLDPEINRIIGMIDNIEAVKQTTLLILSTDRFAHTIFSENYGVDNLVEGSGQLQQLVTDALLVDDRITGIEDFVSSTSGDEMNVSFTLVTVFGSIAVERSF
ncbi:DUF2634 domain-containing protein [Paenibacillus gansuensis]|uniref:DUF2634 domain-containing protein n=1 Tax=Paenibacillus gansuensis TaxID=306542 RepID=A0ABW5PDT9_9BACL